MFQKQEQALANKTQPNQLLVGEQKHSSGLSMKYHVLTFHEAADMIMGSNRRCFHEYIDGPCKLFWDIDAKHLSYDVVPQLVQLVREYLQTFYKIENVKDPQILAPVAGTKYSRHVYFSDVWFVNREHIKEMALFIGTKLPVINTKPIVDTTPYSRGFLRMPFCMKLAYPENPIVPMGNPAPSAELILEYMVTYNPPPKEKLISGLVVTPAKELNGLIVPGSVAAIDRIIAWWQRCYGEFRPLKKTFFGIGNNSWSVQNSKEIYCRIQGRYHDSNTCYLQGDFFGDFRCNLFIWCTSDCCKQRVPFEFNLSSIAFPASKF